MTRLLLTLTAVAGILAQAWGQSSAVRYDNATKAVTAPIPFRVGQSAVDPTAPGNGSIWYDTATNTLEARINGATVSLGTTITGLDTRVMFFDGANNPAGDAGMTYNKTTDTLTVPNLDVSTLASDLTIDGDLTVNAVTMTGTLALPDNVRQTLNPGAIVAGLNVGSFAGNPSTPINGDIWYDSTANTLDAQIAGVTVNLGGVSLGADNTWTGTNAFGVLSSLGATSFTPANANVTLSPTGTGLVTISPATTGSISNMTVAATALSASGVVTVANGTGSALSIKASNGSGWFANDASYWSFVPNGSTSSFVTLGKNGAGAGQIGLNSTGMVFWSSTADSYSGAADTHLVREAAATLQMGVDATTGVNQKLKAMDASAGTGGNLTLAAGTGTTAGGALILQTAATGTLTDRLTISAAGAATFSGALSSAGTISSSGVAIGTNVVIPAASAISWSGRATITSPAATVLSMDGYIIGGVQALSGAGAVNLTTQATALTSTGAAQAITLADGVNGQIKTIVHDVDGGSAVLTPTTKTGFSTITFTNVGETVTLQYFTTRGWMVLSSYLATVAP